MGRWGYRVFEGDKDMDIACEIKCPYGAGEDNDIRLVRMVNQTDVLAPAVFREFYQTSAYREKLDEIIKSNREKLDTGLCGQLFDNYRALEHEDWGKYRVIIVGAMMMRAGARIRQADLDHLRELAQGFTGRHGYVSPIAEDGFRHVGKVQFLAALDHYQAGIPRDFGEPCCFQCGMIKADIGKALKKCGKCGRAWYCNVECQTAAWKDHKRVCKPLEQCKFANV